MIVYSESRGEIAARWIDWRAVVIGAAPVVYPNVAI